MCVYAYICMYLKGYIYIYIYADSFQNLRKDIYMHVCMYIQILFFSGSEKGDIYIYSESEKGHTHTHIYMHVYSDSFHLQVITIYQVHPCATP